MKMPPGPAAPLTTAGSAVPRRFIRRWVWARRLGNNFEPRCSKSLSRRGDSPMSEKALWAFGAGGPRTIIMIRFRVMALQLEGLWTLQNRADGLLYADKASAIVFGG